MHGGLLVFNEQHGPDHLLYIIHHANPYILFVGLVMSFPTGLHSSVFALTHVLSLFGNRKEGVRPSWRMCTHACQQDSHGH